MNEYKRNSKLSKQVHCNTYIVYSKKRNTTYAIRKQKLNLPDNDNLIGGHSISQLASLRVAQLNFLPVRTAGTAHPSQYGEPRWRQIYIRTESFIALRNFRKAG